MKVAELKTLKRMKSLEEGRGWRWFEVV